MKLDPHQLEAAQFLCENPHGFLADAPGVGKTAPAVTAAKFNARRLLVGCRAVSRTNWDREIAALWPDLPKENYLIQSHDTFAVSPKARADAKAFKPDCILIDEAHHLRSMYAQRTQAYYGPSIDGRGGLIDGVPFVWPLSGTPMPSNVTTMWTHLHALRPDLITLPGQSRPLTFLEFAERYTHFEHNRFAASDDIQIKVWKNRQETLPELRAIFKRFILRRTEGTIKLPPLNFQPEIVDCPAAKEVLKELTDLQNTPFLKAMHQAMLEAEAAEQEFTWSVPVAAQSQITQLRRLMGEVKAPVVGRLIAEELYENFYPKIIVFAYHHSVVEMLYEQLIDFNPVVITGATSQKKRQEAIDQFQTEPHVRPFIGQIQACNESITLTAADEVAVVEDDWNPDTLVQAVKRAHRRGQTKSVRARIFGLANSLDEGVVRVRTRKAKQVAEVL